jgi:hypothetical protein
MTTYQTAGNVLVAISRETITGTAATATGATQLRITDSPGLELKRGIIQSSEKREDGLKTMGRLGNKMVDGSYNAEVSVGGGTDIIVEAIMRGTWSAAAPTTFASMTTVTVGTNTLTAAAGVWDTQSIRTGDIITLTGTSQSANHNLRTPVVSVSTLVVTVATSTYTAVSASASGTVTRLKKVVSATTPTRYTHTIEQNDEDTDLSELFLGCRVVGVKLSLKPNGHVQATYTFMGLDRTQLTTGTSPYFTSPTLTTNLGLIADDASIRYDGSSVADFTGFDLDFQITAAGQPVIGSLVSPDIFDNDCAVSGTITGLRSDFSKMTKFDAETEFEMNILLQELASAPKPCLNIFLPRCKFTSLSAPVGGGDGAKVVSYGVMVGPKVATTGYDGTIANISSSA